MDPHQFLGLEINPRAAAIAELVLWIGYLQWHYRIHGQRTPPEPILRAFKNIECRDAVLAYDEVKEVTWAMARENPNLPGLPDTIRSALSKGRAGSPLPAAGGASAPANRMRVVGEEHSNSAPSVPSVPSVLSNSALPAPHSALPDDVITVWDRTSTKPDLVTGRDVPDETKRVPLLAYTNPRPADWPYTDFIVGNPPFIGNKRMRDALGDGYAETLRAAYPNVPETADFVMYWWHNAAELVRTGMVKRFGLITTNSLRQTFNRRVVKQHIGELSLVFAIADHPWVDIAEGAAVRIAMTVGEAGKHPGELLTVTREEPLDDGSATLAFVAEAGFIDASLKLNDSGQVAVSLNANKGMAFTGMYPLGQGFVLMPEEVSTACGTDSEPATVVKPFIIARDLAQISRKAQVIDFYPLSQDEARRRFPALFQWVFTRVKPERDVNPVEERRRNWWLFTRPIPALRDAVSGLERYIAVPRTAKWFTFQFVSADTRPDTSVVAIVSDDAWILGVLSARIHLVWAVSMAGRLGVGNDTRYQHQETFNPFPFPLCGEPEKDRIRKLAEDLDAHRKRAQADHGLTLTGMYNVLEKLRGCAREITADNPSGAALTAKEKLIHDKGLVSVLKQLHDDLDAAVFAAYGWPATLTDAEILERLVALNAERAAEEKRGIIHYLRPDYQAAKAKSTAARQDEMDLPEKPAKSATPSARKSKIVNRKSSWPASLSDRVRAVEAALHAAAGPATAEDLAKQFARAKPEVVREILETLVTMGRAHQKGPHFTR